MGDVIHTKLDAAGRLLVPAEIRDALGFKPGGTVVVRIENGALRVVSQAAALKRIQELLRPLVPEGVSLADELIAERRAEAARDDQGT